MQYVFTFLFIIYSTLTFGQEIIAPQQVLDGPGGKDYSHEKVRQYNFAENPDGFWLFEPDAPKPEKANVIVFVHGYGAYNPMIYGKWIKHLVKKGNTIIFPRYQRNLLSPSPKHFTENVVEAIHNALDTLKTDGHVAPITDNLSLVGHSYGGVISANLCVYFKRYLIPKPKAVMLVSPGTGPFSGGLLDTYEDFPSDINLLVMVSDKDRTVGDKIGKLIYKTATKVKNRNLIRQYSDYYGSKSLTSGHDESYAVDKEFDSGVNNFSTKRALKIGRLNAIDFFAYWKLFDALNAFTRENKYKEYAFGNTPEQRYMGQWSDGKKVRELKVTVPKEDKNTPLSSN